MVIRPAICADYEAVAELLITSYDAFMCHYHWFENYRAGLSDTAKRAKFSTVLVAEEEGAIIGTVTIYTDTDRHGASRPLNVAGQVGMLAVSEAARSRGVGQRLMEAAIHEAALANRNAVVLHTMPSMLDAQRLYRRMGFNRDLDEDMFDDKGDLELVGYRIEIRVPPQN